MLSVFMETMPTHVTEEIKKFCEEVTPGQLPVYVPVAPQTEAEIDKCHVNVEEHIKSHGGTPIYGWIIWQSPALLHALFHCNWMSPDGELIDITPKVDGETKILFLPDPAKQWKGRYVPSRRNARRSDPLIARFVAVNDQMDKIRVKYLPGQPFSSIDAQSSMALMFESSMLVLTVSGSWKTNPGEVARAAADRRARNKAERKRRKQQRRRK